MSNHSAEPFPAAPFSPGRHGTSTSSLRHNAARRRPKSNGSVTAAPAFASAANRLNIPPGSIFSTRRSAETTSNRGPKRRKAKSLFSRWKAVSLRHTWLNPLIVCVGVLAVFAANPTPSNPVYPAVALSYPLPRESGHTQDAPVQYGKGAHDFTFVAFYTVVLSFIREFLMQRVIRPLAIMANIKSRAKQSRFMEQMYTAMYFGVFGPFGLYVMSRSPVWYFNTQGMYEGFPHRTHEALFKAYYLLQASYWAQQALVMVLLLEKPRKDFKELVAHHIITLTLIWLSYRFHFTYMGIAVYITHDISDFYFATSKLISYLEWPIVGPYFASFIGVWVYLRHYVNIKILLSLLPLPLPSLTRWLLSLLPTMLVKAIYSSPILSKITHPIFPNWHSQYATIGPFEMDWEGQQYKSWISQWITFVLLAALQSLNLFWMCLIIKVAISFGRTGEGRDERSDDEESEDDEVNVQQGSGWPLQQQQKLESSAVLLNGTPPSHSGSKHVRC